MATLRNQQEYWIGLYDPDQQNRPLWLDGSLVTFLSFNTEHPSDVEIQCTVGRKEGYVLQMLEKRCDLNRPYVCEKPSGKLPQNYTVSND